VLRFAVFKDGFRQVAPSVVREVFRPAVRGDDEKFVVDARTVLFDFTTLFASRIFHAEQIYITE
jgi:hypothetical protein